MVEVHQVKKGISQRPEKGLRIAVSESGMREVIKRSEIKILCNSFCPAHLLADTQSNDCTAQSNQSPGVSKSPRGEEMECQYKGRSRVFRVVVEAILGSCRHAGGSRGSFEGILTTVRNDKNWRGGCVRYRSVCCGCGG